MSYHRMLSLGFRALHRGIQHKEAVIVGAVAVTGLAIHGAIDLIRRATKA